MLIIIRVCYCMCAFCWYIKDIIIIRKIHEMENCKMANGSSPVPVAERSAAVRLLGLRVRILLRALMSVCWEWYVLSGRGLCVGLITRPEESYRCVCITECDEPSIMRRPWPTGGLLHHSKKGSSCKMIYFKLNSFTVCLCYRNVQFIYCVKWTRFILTFIPQ